MGCTGRGGAHRGNSCHWRPALYQRPGDSRRCRAPHSEVLSMAAIKLPDPAGALQAYKLTGSPLAINEGPKRFNRVAFAAAHIVVDPLKTTEPSVSPVLDWEKTLAFRRHLIDL